MSSIAQTPHPPKLWVAARWLTLLITVGLIVSFWVTPVESLRILWYVLIPVLPATFLVNTELWRNICPLATLNMVGGSVAGSRKLSLEGVRTAGLLAIILLAVMVPARRFLLNMDASVLGATIVVVCLLAIAGGFFFNMKAGFCNSICPVLPVERLYGQRPMLKVRNARCLPCTACSKACLDLFPMRSAGILAIGGDRGSAWTMTGYGAFAAAFPGFVLAYYTLTDTTLANAGAVYVLTATWCVASWAALTLAFRLTGVKPETGLVWCAALAVGLYYWYAPPGIAQQFELNGAFVWVMRAGTLSLVGAWLLRGLKPSGEHHARAGAS